MNKDGIWTGWAILSFPDKEKAQFAIHSFDDYDMHLLKDDKKPWKESFKRRLGRWVVIQNIHQEVSQQNIEYLCRSLGDVRAINMPTTEDGSHQGYALVYFETKKAADLAVKALNGKYLEDH